MRRTVSLTLVSVLALAGAVVLLGGSSAQEELPPTILSVHIRNVGGDYFQVEWQTDEPTKGGIQYGMAPDYGMTVKGGSTYETTHYLNVTNLKRDTTYHFRVYAENLAGTLGYSDDYTVTIGEVAEDGGGLSGWTWAVIAIVVVLAVYLLFLRPARG